MIESLMIVQIVGAIAASVSLTSTIKKIRKLNEGVPKPNTRLITLTKTTSNQFKQKSFIKWSAIAPAAAAIASRRKKTRHLKIADMQIRLT